MASAWPSSLRARLLWLLIGVVSLAVTVQAASTYRTALAQADDIADYHMQQTAMSLRYGLPLTESVDSQSPRPTVQPDEFIIQVWSTDGLRVFRSFDAPILPQRALLGFSDLQVGATQFRVFSVASTTHVIQVAQDMKARRDRARTLAWRTIAPMAVMTPVLVLLIWWVVSASLAPVARLRREVAERQPDDLSEVSEAGLPSEVRPLIREINLLFGRVGQAFRAQENFVADAAHELRSPLSALKLQVEGLRRADGDVAREVALGRLGQGIDRATRLVSQLLTLARQQASAAGGVRPQTLDLTELGRWAVADAAPAAAARGVDLGVAATDAAPVDGNPEALRVMVRNLLDNAIKYTPRGGTVDLTIRRVDHIVALEVEDSGPGIPEGDRERVFDRFYRAAGTDAAGSGLGLAIVKAIADLHGARLGLDRSPRLGGLRVTVQLPASDPGLAPPRHRPPAPG